MTAERIAEHQLAYQHRQLQVLPASLASVPLRAVLEARFRYPTHCRWGTARLKRVGGYSKVAKPPPFCRS